MPRRRRKCLAQASTQAPVLPAETKASARPSATARTPTSSELSRRLTASRGSSAMPIASGAWRMAMCSGLYETPSSTFWMRRSSPTSRHSMSVASETWATPCTAASGAWSPPMASTAMVGMLGVRPGNHGERGERAGEREREAQRRPTRCGGGDARRELVAAGGRSEQPFGSAAAAALPRIVRCSRHGYSDRLLAMLRVRYTAWDGTQEIRLEADRVFEKLAEYLSFTDDVQQALDWLLHQGPEWEQGVRGMGPDAFLEQLREAMRSRYREVNLREAF